jgi:hypothetical protein
MKDWPRASAIISQFERRDLKPRHRRFYQRPPDWKSSRMNNISHQSSQPSEKRLESTPPGVLAGSALLAGAVLFFASQLFEQIYAREGLAQNPRRELFSLALEKNPILIDGAAHINGPHVRIDRSDALHHTNAIKLGHLYIRNHPIRRMIEIAGAPIDAVMRGFCFEAFRAQSKGNHLGQAFIVLYD